MWININKPSENQEFSFMAYVSIHVCRDGINRHYGDVHRTILTVCTRLVEYLSAYLVESFLFYICNGFSIFEIVMLQMFVNLDAIVLCHAGVLLILPIVSDCISFIMSLDEVVNSTAWLVKV